ncbi:MAG: hypothetical protein WC852_00730 [Candidatus Nanoarchaeia archaeon]
MTDLYKLQITVSGDTWGVPSSGLNFWNYTKDGKKITLPYTFSCIAKANSKEEAEKKCMNDRTLRMVYKTHYFQYFVTGIAEAEEGKDLPLEKRVEMLKKKFMVLEE